MKRRVIGKKLLVASIGVATISYVACSTSTTTTDAGADAAADGPVTSGNLMPPPPIDAGDDGASDAGTD
jgi:hypothetical protein